MNSKLIQFMRDHRGWPLWLASVAITVGMAEILVAAMEQLLLGKVSWDYLLTGAIVSFFLAALVIFAVALTINKMEEVERLLLKQTAEYAQTRLGLALDATQLLFWELDLVSDRIHYDEDALHLLRLDTLGVSAPRKLAQWIELVHPDDRTSFVAQFQAALLPGDPIFDMEYRLVFPSGELIWVHTKGRVVQRSAMGAAEQGVGTSLNITERKRAELAVRKEIALRKQMMEALPGVFYMLDQSGRFQTWNRNLEKVTQRDEHALAQMGALDLFAPEEKELVASKIRHTFETGVGNVEARLVAKDGSSTPYFLTGLALQIDGAPALIGIGADISELKAAQARIDQLAHFDHLTGLPNRSLLHDRIRYCLGIAQRNQQKLALFFFDLDHFKHVNDSLGHSMGDRLLIEIALRLKTSIRQQDTVARLGGDEFVLVLPDTDAEEAARVAEKLLSVVSQPYYIDGHELVATPSIGIAMYPENGEDFETLSQCADVAMYRTKRSGRNGYCFFVPEMQVNASRYLALASALRHALELGQLSVYYQPQVSIYSNKVIGVEALLRWHHPEFGDISPTEFIPIAEDCGLIAAIGAWTLRTAVRQLKQWIDSGMRAIVMAVNLSSLQFRNDRLPELVAQILSEEGVPAHYLELELTEGAAMDNPVAAMSMMNKLRERGVRIAIDDFGMGHSSLGHLKRFELNRLKIDKSFVMNITVDLEDKAIVRAIISMANSLNIQVIAEGVETLEQFAYLREQGCHEVQGDYFCPAVPAEQVELFMRNFRGRGVAQAAGSLV